MTVTTANPFRRRDLIARIAEIFGINRREVNELRRRVIAAEGELEMLRLNPALDRLRAEVASVNCDRANIAQTLTEERQERVREEDEHVRRLESNGDAIRQLVVNWVTEWYGEKCDEPDEDCPCCKAHRNIDALFGNIDPSAAERAG